MKLHNSDVSPSALRAGKSWVFAIWLFTIAIDRLDWVNDLPLSLFEPVGFMKFLPESFFQWFFQDAVIWGFKFALIGLLLLVLMNIKSHITTLLTCLLLTCWQAIGRGFAGYMHHTDMALLYAAYFLALFPLADAWVRKRKPQEAEKLNLSGIPLVAILGSFCLTYTMVGTYRLVHGGIEVFTSNSFLYWVLRNNYQTPATILDFGPTLIQVPWLQMLLNAGFPIVTLFEITAPLCLVSRKYRFAFVAVMVPFHFVSLVFMNIMFWENLLMFVFLLDFNRWFPRRNALNPGA